MAERILNARSSGKPPGALKSHRVTVHLVHSGAGGEEAGNGDLTFELRLNESRAAELSWGLAALVREVRAKQERNDAQAKQRGGPQLSRGERAMRRELAEQRARVARLAEKLGCTPDDLLAIVGVDPAAMSNLQATNSGGVGNPGPCRENDSKIRGAAHAE